jgi:hypothetical protein
MVKISRSSSSLWSRTGGGGGMVVERGRGTDIGREGRTGDIYTGGNMGRNSLFIYLFILERDGLYLLWYLVSGVGGLTLRNEAETPKRAPAQHSQNGNCVFSVPAPRLICAEWQVSIRCFFEPWSLRVVQQMGVVVSCPSTPCLFCKLCDACPCCCFRQRCWPQSRAPRVRLRFRVKT